MVMSPDERTTELIHLAVDNEATKRDLAELDELLASSAEARVMHDEIEDLVRQLNGLPAAEAPHLKEAILSEIGRGSTSNVTPFRSRRRRLVAIAAWAVAASIVVGIGIDRIIERRDHSVQPGQASASMTRLGVDEWPIVADVSSTGARLVVRRNGDLFAVEPVVSAHAPMTIRWDAGRFDLSEASPAPEAGRDAAEVTFSAPKKPATIILRRRPDAFGTTEIQLSAAGKETARATLTLD
jgi:hypothetical protein